MGGRKEGGTVFKYLCLRETFSFKPLQEDLSQHAPMCQELSVQSGPENTASGTCGRDHDGPLVVC